MNNVKQLKLILAIVVIASAGLIGFTQYRYNKLSSAVENFKEGIQNAETAQEADAIAKDFFDSTAGFVRNSDAKW